MFNSYYCPVVLLKKVERPATVILITERVVPEGANFVLHKHSGLEPMVDPALVAIDVTAPQRAAVGKISPSAKDFLSPSLEFQQNVAATLANLDDKFSYEAAIAKLTAQTSTPDLPTDSEQSKSE